LAVRLAGPVFCELRELQDASDRPRRDIDDRWHTDLQRHGSTRTLVTSCREFRVAFAQHAIERFVSFAQLRLSSACIGTPGLLAPLSLCSPKLADPL
jgi:hypothetical protein